MRPERQPSSSSSSSSSNKLLSEGGHLSLRASRSDSSNVKMSPSLTGPGGLGQFQYMHLDKYVLNESGEGEYR